MASDGSLKNLYTGTVERWPTYEEVAQTVQELNELGAKLEQMKAEKERMFGPR